ncbi:hypothetical protein HAX54_028690 [Datura stramonium]|uniref:Uncharacterized protein n=1 Tax=Datura stramonium TaxID=4076 RepID=A0ABS8S9P4_DATST|nr:hypothetical protein [Datura stramonium]
MSVSLGSIKAQPCSARSAVSLGSIKASLRVVVATSTILPKSCFISICQFKENVSYGFQRKVWPSFCCFPQSKCGSPDQYFTILKGNFWTCVLGFQGRLPIRD